MSFSLLINRAKTLNTGNESSGAVCMSHILLEITQAEFTGFLLCQLESRLNFARAGWNFPASPPPTEAQQLPQNAAPGAGGEEDRHQGRGSSAGRRSKWKLPI